MLGTHRINLNPAIDTLFFARHAIYLAMPKSPPLSDAVGDYLKAIWALAKHESVSTKDLANHLGVTAPSVTGMLGKLAKLELIHYERYYGARLTEKGRIEAMRLLRRHRLFETFLIDYLAYSWDEVHEEAERMEHTMSAIFTERLAEKLGQPSFDPHGDPIPTAEGELPQLEGKKITELRVGESLQVTRILSQEGEVLSYLSGLGLCLGVVLELVTIEPFGKLYQLQHKDQTIALSAELAAQVEGQVR